MTRSAARLACACALALTSGCRDKETAGAATVASASANGRSPPVRTPVTPPSASASAVPVASASPGVGGPWVRCYAHFRPTSTPVRDVTRLGALCGPQNGMKQLGATIEGESVEDQPAKTHAIALERGQCVRLFAVGDEGIKDLGVKLAGPKGERLGGCNGEPQW